MTMADHARTQPRAPEDGAGAPARGAKVLLADPLSEQNHGLVETPLRAKLRLRLESDAVRGSLVISRQGKLSRGHYAALLSVQPSYLSAHARHIFDHFESSLDVCGNGDRRLGDMRSWLKARYAAGELKIRDGKADRTAFAKAFNFKGGTFLLRYPAIAELFLEFEARIRKEGYQPTEIRTQLDALGRILAEAPPLNKTGLSVSRTDVAARMGVPESRLRSAPFDQVIADKDAELLAAAKQSKVDPYLHGRRYRFSDLAPPFSTQFLTELGERFGQVFEGYAPGSAKLAYLNLHRLLAWIGESKSSTCTSVVAAVACGQPPGRDDWEDVNRRPIGTPYRRAKGTPLGLRGTIDAGRRFRAAAGVGRA